MVDYCENNKLCLLYKRAELLGLLDNHQLLIRPGTI
jgi:hypothetical protein